MAKAAAGEPRPKRKAKPKPKLTHKERHQRFIDMAREVEASDDPKEFERAFGKVVTIRPSRPTLKPKATGGSRSTSK
jgi:hypothetical protein